MVSIERTRESKFWDFITEDEKFQGGDSPGFGCD